MNRAEQHVSMLYEMMPEHPGYKLLKEHGRAFTKIAHSLDGAGPQGECYKTSWIEQSKDLVYTEGVGCIEGLIPLDHAWLVIAGTQNCVDPTWNSPSDYFGVSFTYDFMSEWAERVRFPSVFQNLYMLRMSPEKVYDYLVQGLKTNGIPRT